MTGRHPVRVDVTDWIPGQSNKKTNKLIHPPDRYNLTPEEVAITKELEKPWLPNFLCCRMAPINEGHWPIYQGFDFNIGGNHRGGPPNRESLALRRRGF